jgi:hypothetical protein
MKNIQFDLLYVAECIDARIFAERACECKQEIFYLRMCFVIF